MDSEKNTHPITLIGLPEARERGERDDSAVDLDRNPHVLEIELQGCEAENHAALAEVASVTKAVGTLRIVRLAREQFDPIYKRAAAAWVGSEKELRRTEGEIDERRRTLPMLPFGSTLVWLILGVIAIAEFVLNRAAFVVAGDDSVNTDILALAVGIGLVAGAHFLGVALRRMVDRLPGTPINRVAILVASVFGAVLIAVFSVNVLRAAYYAELGVDVPGGSLALLQVFMLWVAVALSAAHAHPLRDNLERVRTQASAAGKGFETARAEWNALFEKHADAHAHTWSVVAAAAADADIQLAHTERGRQAFAQGANGSLAPADAVPNRIARSWDDWLDRNPLELPTPTVVADVERLIAEIDGGAATPAAEKAARSASEGDLAAAHQVPAPELNGDRAEVSR